MERIDCLRPDGEGPQVGLDHLDGQLGVPRANDVLRLVDLRVDSRGVHIILLEFAIRSHAPFRWHRTEVRAPFENASPTGAVSHELLVVPAVAGREIAQRASRSKRLAARTDLDVQLAPRP